MIDIKEKNGIVTSIANVSFQDIEKRQQTFTTAITEFLISKMIFPLTALLAEAKSLVILEIISPFL